MEFRRRTLTQIGDMICGNFPEETSHFIYRSSKYLTEFFEEADTDYRQGLPHDRVTSELACPVGQVGRMSLCPSPIRKSSARTSCGSRGTAAQV
ncbi:hypothetical protein F1D59_33690 [Streptomyces sp. INR7]|nr:hypothetical protein F1D59_33690 [Streptomyces sp. INR7]